MGRPTVCFCHVSENISEGTPHVHEDAGIRIVQGPFYYVQDTRQIVGNCILWWAEGESGYTTELDKAHVFTEADVMRDFGLDGKKCRGTDVPWPKGVVDARASRHCRMEPLRDWRSKQQQPDIGSNS